MCRSLEGEEAEEEKEKEKGGDGKTMMKKVGGWNAGEGGLQEGKSVGQQEGPRLWG